MINEMENFVNLLDGNRVPDMGKKWMPLIPYKFEKYLTPESLKTIVLNSNEIDRICKVYGGGDNKKEAELRDIVKSVLEEIGFKRNMAVIRFLGITLNKILRQMTHGVHVNLSSVNNIKRELVQSHRPVLYLPSHRSYADFVLMSYICFAYDIEIPAIAAGMDFHAMVAMGRMLRNTGAFFMRRSFSNDKMYWEVFREYIRTLITQYHSGVEFFIEGTRSRSCKALPPKIGLFSMLLEPFMKRQVFDVLVVPIAISYDRQIEENLFAYELLGVPKPKESTLALFKAFEVMDSCHGRMFVNFGKAISLHDYFQQDRSKIYWTSNEPFAPTLTKDRLQLISELSCEIIDQQQQLFVLTTFNLIAIYFSYRSMINEQCSRDQLKYGVTRLANFLKKSNALLSQELTSKSDSSDDVSESLEIHSNVLRFTSSDSNAPLELVFGKLQTATNVNPSKLKGHTISTHTMRNCLPFFLLQIYSNPCLYWLHQPAFCILLQRLQLPQDELFTEFQRIKRIFSNEFVTRKTTDNHDINELILNSIQISEDDELANLLLTSILPFVFCYFNVAEVISNQLSTKPFSNKELFVKVQMHVESRLNARAMYVHPLSLSLESIGSALQSFVAIKCVTKHTIAGDKPTTHYIAELNELESILLYLRRYCSVLKQFNGLSNYAINSKL